MAEYNTRPKILRVDVLAECCGEHIEFVDVELGSHESIACEECGRRVEVSLDGFIQLRND